MSFKYRRTVAAALCLITLCGCASRGKNETLNSGDLPVSDFTTSETASTETEVTTFETTTAPPLTTRAPETEVFDGSETGTSEYTISALSTVLYATDILNVRETPSTEAKVVGQLNVGDDAEVTGQTSHGWYRINYNGGVAFVYGQYMSTEKPVVEEGDITIPEGYYFADADDYMFVVNKDTFLPEDYAIETDFVQGSYELEMVAAKHCRDMIAAAEKDGIDLKVLSAYRTIEYQKKLFERNVNSRMEEDGMTYDEAYYDVSINIAPPGGSEHNAGLAVDIIDENHWDTYEDFENTEEFEWLRSHCTEYGFILRYLKGKEDITGYVYEPWHYRYVGVENAKEVMASGLCLEEYLGTVG